MNYPNRIFLASAIFLLLNNNFTISQSMNNLESMGLTATYHIHQNSELKLKGKTNLNSFDCVCKEKFTPNNFIIKTQQDSTSIFTKTKLSIPISSFDCGNRIMNQDLQKALHAHEYPYISIELQKVKSNSFLKNNSSTGWFNVNPQAIIDLNGNQRIYWLNIYAKKISDCKFRFKGEKTLCMSDFCVTPPTAMLGLVKVNDEISIELDLEITID